MVTFKLLSSVEIFVRHCKLLLQFLQITQQNKTFEFSFNPWIFTELSVRGSLLEDSYLSVFKMIRIIISEYMP